MMAFIFINLILISQCLESGLEGEALKKLQDTAITVLA